MRNNLSFRSIAALTAMKALIKADVFKEKIAYNISQGVSVPLHAACEDIVNISYTIADLMDSEGKKRHAAEQKQP